MATAGLLCAVAAATSSARPTPLKIIPSCSRFARSPVVYRSPSGEVTVRRGRVRGDGGVHDWACPPSGSAQAWPLGGSVGGGFPAGVTVRGFVSLGPWLVDVADARGGWSTCLTASRGRACARSHHQLELVDVAAGSEQSAPCAASVDIHLSTLRARDGDRTAAVVWTQSAGRSRVTLAAMTERDRRTPGGESSFGLNRPVTGDIDPSSVRLRGLRVSFVEDGRRRSLRLGV